MERHVAIVASLKLVVIQFVDLFGFFPLIASCYLKRENDQGG